MLVRGRHVRALALRFQELRLLLVVAGPEESLRLVNDLCHESWCVGRESKSGLILSRQVGEKRVVDRVRALANILADGVRLVVILNDLVSERVLCLLRIICRNCALGL